MLEKLEKVLLKYAEPTWVGKGTTVQGKRVIDSFSQAGQTLPQNSTVSSDTSFVAGKPIGVLNIAKSPIGREFLQTKNLQTNKTTTQETQKGTLPPMGSVFDGKNIKSGPITTKPMK